MRRHGPVLLMCAGAGSASLAGSFVVLHGPWWLFLSVAAGFMCGQAIVMASRQR